MYAEQKQQMSKHLALLIATYWMDFIYYTLHTTLPTPPILSIITATFIICLSKKKKTIIITNYNYYNLF